MTPYFVDERAVLIRGEALDALRAMPDESVDAVVTDPPAGISFMNKGWDGDKGGRDQWVVWLAEIFREVLRVLKPGGHALVWALPRTTHWTATALEDAGFDVRDRIAHAFGCVPPETEMLTERGWVRPEDLRKGESVVHVDSRGGASLAPLAAVSWYDHDGEMVRVKTRSTEQLLTEGHTMHGYQMHATNSRGTLVDTEMSRTDASVFADSDQPGVYGWKLPLAARDAAPRTLFATSDVAELCGWVIAEGHFHKDVAAVSIYQNEGPNADRIRALLDRLGVKRSEYKRTRDNYDGTPRDSVQWYLGTTEPMSIFLRARLAGEKPTPTEDMAWLPQDQALALFEALVEGDGSRNPSGTSGAWYQKRPEVRAWFQTLCFRLGYRTSENASKSMISWCRSDSTEIQRGSFRRRACTRVPYRGKVWCPTVPSGRWVARYKGNVFVTGNSGFPKSLNVSKAIDASLGAERALTGPGASNCPDLHAGRECTCYLTRTENSQSGATKQTPATAPGSPEARQWEGFGTALKPAVEDWWLVRKPLGMTVAACVLEHGTGALNIDACRVGTEDTRAPTGTREETGWGTKSGIIAGSPLGRFPANLVLSHDERCVDVGIDLTDDAYACVPGCPVRGIDEQSGTRKSGSMRKGTKRGVNTVFGKIGGSQATDEDIIASEGGASRFFYCPKPPKKETERGCEHLTPRTAGEATDREDGSAGLNSPRAGAGRTGGAKNHHPCKKSVTLMRYLCRLICPPAGLILDPFCGSGSTGVAAIAEGFSFVGIERDLDDKTGEPLGYCEIIKARLTQALIDHAKKEDAE